jgi:hypothetical protein
VANADALMHPQAQFTNRYFHRSIGNVTKALMQDIGWTLGNSIEEIESNLTFSVFPNPSNEQIQVLARNLEGTTITVRLVDVSGKTIRQTEIFKNEIVVDVSDFERGVYFVILISESDSYLGTTKLIVN